MRRIEKADNGTPVRTDIVVYNPAFIGIIFAFVMWLIRVLGERVVNALVENLFSVFWS